MLLLLFDSLLLIFITTSLGILAHAGLSRLYGFPAKPLSIPAGAGSPASLATDPIPASSHSASQIPLELPGIFLTGLLLSTFYFSLLSFWLPVNWVCLIPLLAMSLWSLSRNKRIYRQLFVPAAGRGKGPLRPKDRWAYLIPIICVALLLLCYGLKPSTSPDSRGYHFLAIQWYEHFKVVPGLGNLHGRLAFNPAAFLISAAYALTGLAGRSVFPLNSVLTALLLFWILAKLIANRDNLAGLVWLFLLILLFRPLLAYMSSPSSDPLTLVCIAYPLIRLFELLRSRKPLTLPLVIIPLLLMLYAPIAKLSAYPLLPLIPYIFFLLPAKDKRLSRLLLLALIAACLWLPWLGRNYIMSGYLAYPIPHSDLFHSDWKIPAEMLQIDFDYGKYSARSSTNTLAEFQHLQSLSFFGWFLPLLSLKLRIRAYTELFLLLAALFSPVLWVLLSARARRARKTDPGRIPDLAQAGSPQPGSRMFDSCGSRMFIFWLILYAGSWTWGLLSIDFRFGTIFLLLTLIFPLLLFCRPGDRPRWRGMNPVPSLISALLVAFTVYYLIGGFRLYKATFKDRCLVDFPYRTLHSGVKLYLSDSCHNCRNAGFPCEIRDYGWLLGTVEMRGESLDQGFRNTGFVAQKEHALVAP